MSITYKPGMKIWVISCDERDSTEILRRQLIRTGNKMPGKILAVSQEAANSYVRIEFDDFIEGHDGDGDGKPGHCWGMYSAHIIPRLSDNYGEEDDA